MPTLLRFLGELTYSDQIAHWLIWSDEENKIILAQGDLNTYLLAKWKIYEKRGFRKKTLKYRYNTLNIDLIGESYLN